MNIDIYYRVSNFGDEGYVSQKKKMGLTISFFVSFYSQIYFDGID